MHKLSECQKPALRQGIVEGIDQALVGSLGMPHESAPPIRPLGEDGGPIYTPYVKDA